MGTKSKTYWSQTKSLWLRVLHLTGCLSLAVIWIRALPVLAQTSTVTDVVSTSLNSTFSNSSGLSITNNGSPLNYQGPLNSVTNQSVNPTLQVTISGETLINDVPNGVAEFIPSGTIRVNSLSPQLESATLDVSGSKGSVSLGIGGTVPSFTAAGGAILIRRSETGVQQTFSIFPNLQPSVFNRDLYTAIIEGADRTRRDALRTGAIKTDVISTPASAESILFDVPRTGVLPGDSKTGNLPAVP